MIKLDSATIETRERRRRALYGERNYVRRGSITAVDLIDGNRRRLLPAQLQCHDVGGIVTQTSSVNPFTSARRPRACMPLCSLSIGTAQGW